MQCFLQGDSVSMLESGKRIITHTACTSLMYAASLLPKKKKATYHNKMKEDNQGSWKILTSPYSAVIYSCCCRTVIKKDTGRPFFFQTINEQYRRKPKEGCHMLLFMSFRFRGNTVVPDIHSSNLALLKFSFRMADTMSTENTTVCTSS